MSRAAVAPRRASRVLLVDPDADTRALYRESLRTIADDIVEAVDARDALAKAFAHPPKAIVTEIRLPGFDGCSLCDILRRDGATREVAIIVVTGESRPDELARARQAPTRCSSSRRTSSGSLPKSGDGSARRIGGRRRSARRIGRRRRRPGRDGRRWSRRFREGRRPHPRISRQPCTVRSATGRCTTKAATLAESARVIQSSGTNSRARAVPPSSTDTAPENCDGQNGAGANFGDTRQKPRVGVPLNEEARRNRRAS